MDLCAFSWCFMKCKVLNLNLWLVLTNKKLTIRWERCRHRPTNINVQQIKFIMIRSMNHDLFLDNKWNEVVNM